MRIWRALDTRAKVIVTLLLIGGLSSAATAWLGYTRARTALDAEIRSNLTTLRDTTALAIHRHFETTRAQASVLANDRSVITALRAFADAIPKLETERLSAEQGAALARFYETDFLAKLVVGRDAKPVADAFMPKSEAARYLQLQYLAQNPHTGDNRRRLLQANDGSAYSQAHGAYHPTLNRLIETFGFYDLLLIRPDGLVVYSVTKELDFLSDLKAGPFADSGLGRAFAALRRDRGTQRVVMQDFDFYQPSLGAPAAFLAAPVYDGGELLGVVALQLATEPIDAITTLGRRWQQSGLGSSGEVFLVGSDYTMRSAPRPFLEQPDAYLDQARKVGVDSGTVDRIAAYRTPLLLQSVPKETVHDALMGESYVRRVERNYAGQASLVAAAPLRLQGVDWAIVARKAESESDAPIAALRRETAIVAVALVLLLTLLAMWLARVLTAPTRTLIERMRLVDQGKLDIDLRLDRNDELGQLATSMHGLVGKLRERTEQAQREVGRVEGLLSRFLPEGIVRQIRSRQLNDAELNIGEAKPNVSLVLARLSGYEAMLAQLAPEEAVRALDELVQLVDAAAERVGVEKVRTAGDKYFAVAGLSTPQIDHAQRALDFALEMRSLIERFGRDSGSGLQVKIGVTSGPVLAGVIGRTRLAFDLWGPTTSEVERLNDGARPGEIRVAATLAQKVQREYRLAAPVGQDETAWNLLGPATDGTTGEGQAA